MSARFSLTVSDDGTRAELNFCSADTTLEEVTQSLKEQKIRCGVQHDNIAKAIMQARQTGAAQNNIVAAITPAPEIRVRLSASSEWLSGDDLEQFIHSLKRIAGILKQEREMRDVPAGMFVSKGETCLEVEVGQEAKNIFGEPLLAARTSLTTHCTDLLVKKTATTGYELVAGANGYLVINETNAFDIIDPFEISADALNLFFKILPVAYGRERLSDSYYRTMGTEAPGVESSPVLHQDELRKILGGKEYQKMTLKKGVAPVPGRDAALHIKVAIEKDIIENSDGRVDYKNIKRFCEIQKGTLIAEKTKLRPPKQGINVAGQIIPVQEARDAPFYPGENIALQENGDAILYFAAKTGVLSLGFDSVQIAEDLTIKGDVGLQTGNLRYSKDIAITGNVSAGFSIDCGGDLAIMGSVEDNVRIVCKGNLNIEKGLFGEKSNVAAGGNATIGFIHNSNVRVRGDLTVGDYIIQSNVFCNGKLVVEGRYFSSDDKGCVVGGQVGSIKKLVLHSVGSSAALTSLCCGIDMDLYGKFIESKKVSVALKKRITDAQAKIGFSMQDKNVLEKLKALPESRREFIKQLLEKIRSDIALLTEIENKMAQLNQISMAPSCDDLAIEIQKDIFPEVFVTIREFKKRITDRFYEARMLVHNGELVCRQL